MEELKAWIEDHNINCEIVEEVNCIRVPKLGTLLFVEPKNGILLTNEDSKDQGEYYFKMTDEEKDFVEEEDEVRFLLFRWGSRFYYSSTSKTGKDQINDVIYLPEFNEFLSLGEYEPEVPIPFVNLGVHTGYELLNGSGEPKDWVKKAKYFKHPSLAICDKDTLAGTLAFQLECGSEVKSIMGATYSVAYDYDPEADFQNIFEIKVYAKNEKGWRNLLRINTEVNVNFNGFIPEEILLQYNEGIICVIPRDSYFNRIINKSKLFLERIEIYQEIYGKENLYYQIDLNELEDEVIDMENLNNIKTYMKKFYKVLKPIYIGDCYYSEKVNSGVKKLLNDISRKSQPVSSQQYYKDSQTIINENLPLFGDEDKLDIFIESLTNTVEVAEACDFLIDVGNHKLPKFEHEDTIGLYYQKIEEGFTEKVLNKFEDEKTINEYVERIQEENDVIVGAGFVDYFMILWDIVDWSKKNDILVGPGRGSAGGSLVAYLLGVTEIDPIEYDLLFERFMNKTRVSGERAKSADALPDIDVDFEGSKRQEVKRYIEQKYGVSSVCSVGTYSRMKVKSALKDFGRVMGLQFQDINFATKEIPDSQKANWQEIFDNAMIKPKLKSFVQKNAEVCEVIKGVLGQPRAGSIHPSAVLIVPKEDKDGNPMTVFDWLPVKKIDGNLVAEWEGKYVDRAGFLKEDILGIAQLDKFKEVLRLIKVNQGKKINLNKIPVNRRSVFKFFQKGWNEDVFQFGTSGLKSYSKKVRPDNIEDLISMNALFRPGPMDSDAHNDFAKIKHKEKKAKFDPYMDVITKNTHGLYVFQEQVMQAMVVGGLTLAEADQVRTYMKKFDDKSLAKFKEKFIQGYSVLFAEGDGEEIAIKVWDKLYAFSAYGFNRSHSAAYTLMGYWCQYLKVKYPLEFWTGSLNFSDEKNEVPNRLSEITAINLNSKKKIKVMPPDINKSDRHFTSDPEENTIYWSLTKIKHAGEVAVAEILRAREDGGMFFSLEEFLNRVPKSKVNKRVVTNLIVAGAFDAIEDSEGDVVGNQSRKRYKVLKTYYELIKADIPEEIETDENNDKNWFWTYKQRDITGFGEIDYKELLMKKTKVKRVISSYWNGQSFLSWNDTKKGKRGRYDDGEPCTIAGRVLAIFDAVDRNGDIYHKVSIESNNAIILTVLWKEEAKKYGKQFKELNITKGMFAVHGGAFFDDFRGKNMFKVTSRTKVIEL